MPNAQTQPRFSEKVREERWLSASQLTASASPTVLTVVAKLSKHNQLKPFGNDQNVLCLDRGQLHSVYVRLNTNWNTFDGYSLLNGNEHLNKVSFKKTQGLSQQTDGQTKYGVYIQGNIIPP